MSYCQLNSILDAGYPKGALNYWKSSFLTQLSDAAIDTMIEWFARCPSTMGQLILEHLHGAATRVPVSATAFPHRADGYKLPRAVTMDGADADRSVRCLGTRGIRSNGVLLRNRAPCELPGQR